MYEYADFIGQKNKTPCLPFLCCSKQKSFVYCFLQFVANTHHVGFDFKVYLVKCCDVQPALSSSAV